MINLSVDGPHDKWVVITSISNPTYALEKISKLAGWQVVVVADQDTPRDWNLPGVHFLSVGDQLKLPYKTISLIPWNSTRCACVCPNQPSPPPVLGVKVADMQFQVLMATRTCICE